VSRAGSAPAELTVLRVYHSGVVGEWRRRDRALRALGVDVALVSARRWNEGGADVALATGDDAFVVPARTLGRHPYRFVYDPWSLWRALRGRRVDVIDVHEEPASLAAAEVMVLARLAGRRAPVCLYSAQNIPKRFPVPFRWIERATLRRAAAVHTCNQQAGRILRHKGFAGRIADLGLGVDVERFAPDPRAGERTPAAPGADLRVGYVGRLEPHKGVEVLVAAVAATPGVVLEIVGDGPARGRVEQAVDRAGVGHRVTLVGYSDPDRLPATYRRMDVVVVPSLSTPSWIEQFGRVAVEAMASGVAVVASRTGALPEVVGQAAWLVEPGDVAELAQALAALRDDPAARIRLAAAGTRRAQHYDWTPVAQRQA
jgi:glycosyltransferase involved in cell wall biosynthesis